MTETATKPTSDGVEILNRTFGNSPERRQAINKEKEAIQFTERNTAKNGTNGVDGATLSLKGPRQDVSNVAFTEQQIQDYINNVTCGEWVSPQTNRDLLFQGVQIIMQLRGELLVAAEELDDLSGELSDARDMVDI